MRTYIVQSRVPVQRRRYNKLAKCFSKVLNEQPMNGFVITKTCNIQIHDEHGQTTVSLLRWLTQLSSAGGTEETHISRWVPND